MGIAFGHPLKNTNDLFHYLLNKEITNPLDINAEMFWERCGFGWCTIGNLSCKARDKFLLTS